MTNIRTYHDAPAARDDAKNANMIRMNVTSMCSIRGHAGAADVGNLHESIPPSREGGGRPLRPRTPDVGAGRRARPSNAWLTGIGPSPAMMRSFCSGDDGLVRREALQSSAARFQIGIFCARSGLSFSARRRHRDRRTACCSRSRI
jgi:hypothetical protein